MIFLLDRKRPYILYGFLVFYAMKLVYFLNILLQFYHLAFFYKNLVFLWLFNART